MHAEAGAIDVVRGVGAGGWEGGVKLPVELLLLHLLEVLVQQHPLCSLHEFI